MAQDVDVKTRYSFKRPKANIHFSLGDIPLISLLGGISYEPCKIDHNR